MQLEAVGDQSAFVKAAVSSVMFEGVIAAALTGLMILVFLGSWRSTLIITISIPLAILASVAMFSAIGETINVMTLGGLALAVGILVDDATVTIENINWHLEQGKEIESAIMDGARQIVIPATVSLLCICIVFVPMFRLGGVAGYLFRPMAEAVVFALMASYVLSRTLVHTMARYLLANQRSHGHGEAAAADAQSLRHVSARLRASLRAHARRAIGGFSRPRCGARRIFIVGFLAAVALLLRAGAVPRSELLSAGRGRSDQAACARADRHAHRGDGASLRSRSKRRSARRFRRDALVEHRRQHRAADQRHQSRPTAIPARSARATPIS